MLGGHARVRRSEKEVGWHGGTCTPCTCCRLGLAGSCTAVMCVHCTAAPRYSLPQCGHTVHTLPHCAAVAPYCHPCTAILHVLLSLYCCPCKRCTAVLPSRTHHPRLRAAARAAAWRTSPPPRATCRGPCTPRARAHCAPCSTRYACFLRCICL